MIIQRDWALANDHPEGAASCGSSSRVARLLQMIIRHPRHPSHLCQDPNSISRTFLEQLVLVNLIPVPGKRRWCLVSANLTGEGSSCQLLLYQPFSFLQRAIFVNNVMRIKSCVVSILDFLQFIKSCLEWENPVRCFFFQLQL